MDVGINADSGGDVLSKDLVDRNQPLGAGSSKGSCCEGKEPIRSATWGLPGKSIYSKPIPHRGPTRAGGLVANKRIREGEENEEGLLDPTAIEERPISAFQEVVFTGEAAEGNQRNIPNR